MTRLAGFGIETLNFCNFKEIEGLRQYRIHISQGEAVEKIAITTTEGRLPNERRTKVSQKEQRIGTSLGLTQPRPPPTLADFQMPEQR